MFNAPVIITNIPDIEQIYRVNDAQCEDLDAAIERMDQNLFLDTMNEEVIVRWENILGITPLDDDKVEDRRFRIKSKVMERLPYSFRVISHKLDTLCPNGYVMTISEDRTEIHIRLMLKSKKMIKDVGELMEDILPLNMFFNVTIAWNQHIVYATKKYGELKQYTHKMMREEIMDYYDY